MTTAAEHDFTEEQIAILTFCAGMLNGFVAHVLRGQMKDLGMGGFFQRRSARGREAMGELILAELWTYLAAVRRVMDKHNSEMVLRGFLDIIAENSEKFSRDAGDIFLKRDREYSSIVEVFDDGTLTRLGRAIVEHVGARDPDGMVLLNFGMSALVSITETAHALVDTLDKWRKRGESK